MKSAHTPISPELFQKYFRSSEKTAFLTQLDIPKELKKAIEKIVKDSGELFLDKAFVITEPLSPLAKLIMIKVAKKHGYNAEITDEHKQLKYLGSDGGGHYSTDFYDYLDYSQICVTPLQAEQKKKNGKKK